jgi:hypothetical protein
MQGAGRWDGTTSSAGRYCVRVRLRYAAGREAWHAAFAALLRTAAASGLCFCVSFAGVVHGVARICVASLHAYWMASCAPSSLGLSATSQQYFSLKTN